MMHWTSPLTSLYLPGVYIQLLYSILPSLPSFVSCLALWSSLSLLEEGTISRKNYRFLGVYWSSCSLFFYVPIHFPPVVPNPPFPPALLSFQLLCSPAFTSPTGSLSHYGTRSRLISTPLGCLPVLVCFFSACF